MRPRLIVELGVRKGQSTFVFERVARLFDAALVSVDIEDCMQASSYPHWHFVQSDDVAFARRFPAWCAEHDLPAQIDVLFIDTSHVYEHTVQEIDAWFPLLAKHALVFFPRSLAGLGPPLDVFDGQIAHCGRLPRRALLGADIASFLNLDDNPRRFPPRLIDCHAARPIRVEAPESHALRATGAPLVDHERLRAGRGDREVEIRNAGIAHVGPFAGRCRRKRSERRLGELKLLGRHGARFSCYFSQHLEPTDPGLVLCSGARC